MMAPLHNSLVSRDAFKAAHQRDYQRRLLRPQHRSLNRLIRSHAKQLVESGQVDIFPDCKHDHGAFDKASIRNHIEQDLRSVHHNLAKAENNHNRPRRPDRQEDGTDLAYSDIELPSDRCRLVRQPTLEREDAFHDASTVKGKIHIRRRLESGNDDEQVAHLYQVGLLYDDEQDSASDSFNLNSIQHAEPLFPIRPARRAQKHRAGKGGVNQPLHLDLSFSDLGDDEALAQYFMAAARPDSENGQDETVQHRGSAGLHTPLRVIYELISSQPSFDVDACQPPDLVTDVLSDYDCFSDSELDDTPSQREVQEHANNAPADAWVILGDDS